MKIKILLSALLLYCFVLYGQQNTEKWKVFELTLSATTSGNPFKDVKLTGNFISNNDTISVLGFYDGEGIYKIRFMPREEG